MDYEKKYKEMKARVLEMGRGYVKGLDYSKPRQIAEYIDPELKESGDERIKEAIITTIHLYYGEPLEDEAKEMIAWLEKQKPIQNINKEDEEVRQYIVRTIKQKDINVPMVQKALAWLENQGKSDKIVEKAKIEKQRVLVTESDGSANIDWDTRSLEDARKLLEYGLQYINTELEKQGEQKPAWSEWDEKMLNSSVDNLTELMLKYGEKYGNVGKCIDWLKSLKDRVLPQNTWKPSIAQLNALSIVSKGNAPDDIEAIVSLYNDLKKLREE